LHQDRALDLQRSNIHLLDPVSVLNANDSDSFRIARQNEAAGAAIACCCRTKLREKAMANGERRIFPLSLVRQAVLRLGPRLN
jgi:hypothetical protein